MAYINITYQDLEHIFKSTLNGRHITRVVEHPFLARALMVEFPGDPEEDEDIILLTDEVTEET